MYIADSMGAQFRALYNLNEIRISPKYKGVIEWQNGKIKML